MMINQIFDSFERSGFSDEIFSIFGRALTIATRFDSSCKTLARLPLIKISVIGKYALSNDEYDNMVCIINNKYKNLNRAIESLNFKDDHKQILSDARESRNELIHEKTLGASEGFDNMKDDVLSRYLDSVENLVRKIIRGDVLISTIISISNKELVSDYPFSESYEENYVNWVMSRFKT
jgi:hypothetical protein